MVGERAGGMLRAIAGPLFDDGLSPIITKNCGQDYYQLALPTGKAPRFRPGKRHTLPRAEAEQTLKSITSP